MEKKKSSFKLSTSTKSNRQVKILKETFNEKHNVSEKIKLNLSEKLPIINPDQCNLNKIENNSTGIGDKFSQNKSTTFIEILLEEFIYRFIFFNNSIDTKVYEKMQTFELKKFNIQYKFVLLDLSLPENKHLKMCYKTYANAPLCITQTLEGLSRIKKDNGANLIWKLHKFDKMSKLIPALGKWQKYNHFPKTWQLGRKDMLYKNFKKFNKKFSKDFDYMPMTFIFPTDIEEFKTYKKFNALTWIIKPVASSRGRGVHLLSDNSELELLLEKTRSKGGDYLLSHYIDNPHLINNKKYDLRVYVLVTSFSPLKIYFYDEGLVRFASEDYTQGDKENIFVHLTNYSINKNNQKYEKNEENNFEDTSTASKWSFSQYKNYFIHNDQFKDYELIFKKIKDIIIKTIFSAFEENLTFTRGLTRGKNNLFELYGFDILIDNKFNPWLIEVNVSPSLNCDSQLDLNIKTNLISDTLNIVGLTSEHDLNLDLNLNSCQNYIKDFNRQNLSKFKVKICKEFQYPSSKNLELFREEKQYLSWVCEYKEMCNDFLTELLRSRLGKYEMIFPKYKDISSVNYYTNFLKNPGDENILIWKWICSELN